MIKSNIKLNLFRKIVGKVWEEIKPFELWVEEEVICVREVCHNNARKLKYPCFHCRGFGYGYVPHCVMCKGNLELSLEHYKNVYNGRIIINKDKKIIFQNNIDLYKSIIKNLSEDQIINLINKLR